MPFHGANTFTVKNSVRHHGMMYHFLISWFIFSFLIHYISCIRKNGTLKNGKWTCLFSRSSSDVYLFLVFFFEWCLYLTFLLAIKRLILLKSSHLLRTHFVNSESVDDRHKNVILNFSIKFLQVFWILLFEKRHAFVKNRSGLQFLYSNKVFIWRREWTIVFSWFRKHSDTGGLIQWFVHFYLLKLGQKQTQTQKYPSMWRN